MIGRRRALGILGTVAAGGALPMPARAGIARAVKLEELIARSAFVVQSTALDGYSVWENLGGQKRIVTYSRMRVDDHVAGAVPKDPELMIRTLGGRVGEIGQIVHGEAMLKLEEP